MRSWNVFLLFFIIQSGVYAQTFTDKFDNGVIESPEWRKEGVNADVSSKYSLSGNYSFRAYLPAQTYSNARSEIRLEGNSSFPKYHQIMTTWGMAVAIYVPSNFKPDNTSNEIIIQYHGKPDPSDTYKNPPLAVYLEGYDLMTRIRWISRDPGTPDDQKTYTYNGGRVVPGKWNYFVIDTHWDYRANGNGYAKIYHRAGAQPTQSDLIANHNGPIGSQDDDGPYFKLGIYKWAWKTSSKVQASKNSGVQYRELFYDNLQIQKGGIMGNQAPSNQAPSVSVSGPNSMTLPTNSASFTANASDSDGSISSYNWTKVSGPSASLSGATSKTFRATNLVAGNYKFKVVVKDNDGATSSSSVNLTVNPSSGSGGSSGGASPDFTVSAGSDFSVPVEEKNFDLSATWDSDTYNVSSVQWSKVSGPKSYETKMDRWRCHISSIRVGEYVYEVKIVDKNNKVATDRVKVVVTDGEVSNANPIVNAGADKSIDEGNSVAFTASASDTDGSVSAYKWTKVSGPEVSLSNASSNKLTVNNPDAGSYEFKVTVTDNDGATASDNVKLTVKVSGDALSVSAGKDFMVDVDERNFDLSASWDSEKFNVKSVQWSKVSGPKSYETKMDRWRCHISSIRVGEYVYEVKIVDKQNQVATDRVKIVVADGVSSEASDEDLAALEVVPVQNFSTNEESISLVTGASVEMKVNLRHVNGVKLSYDKFDGDLNTKTLNSGMYHYNVEGENGETIQKGTLLIY